MKMSNIKEIIKSKTVFCLVNLARLDVKQNLKTI